MNTKQALSLSIGDRIRLKDSATFGIIRRIEIINSLPDIAIGEKIFLIEFPQKASLFTLSFIKRHFSINLYSV